MSKYFENFAKTFYNLEDNQFNSQLVTNILQRSTFLKEITENSAIAYEYQVKDSDTPEIIAHKLYGDVDRQWIVLLFNNILNPYYDFPLKQSEFAKFIYNKYGMDIDTSKTTLHHYEKKVTKVYSEYGAIKYNNTESFIVNENDINYDTGSVTTRSLPTYSNPILPVVSESFDTALSNTSSVSVTVTINYISVYDYEESSNESKRIIKLLDPSYVGRVEEEFKVLMRNG